MPQDPSQSENLCKFLDDPERLLIKSAETLAYGDVVYAKSDGYVAKAKADASTTLPAIGLYTRMHQVEYKGVFTKSDWSWTIGALVYVSSGTAGVLTQTAPSAGSTYKQIMGVAISATSILLLPNLYIVAN